jgi:hypothetical protein
MSPETGPMPQALGRFGRVVQAVAVGDSGIAGLPDNPAVKNHLRVIHHELTADGWLPTDRDKRRVWWSAAPSWALVVVGVVLVVFGDERSWVYGLVAATAVAYVAFLLGRLPDRLTRTAHRELWRLRDVNEHLSPAGNPSLATYGAAAAAVAVGLYGTTVLLPVDRDLTLAADILLSSPGEQSGNDTIGCGSTCGSYVGPGEGGGWGAGCGGRQLKVRFRSRPGVGGRCPLGAV